MHSLDLKSLLKSRLWSGSKVTCAHLVQLQEFCPAPIVSNVGCVPPAASLPSPAQRHQRRLRHPYGQHGFHGSGCAHGHPSPSGKFAGFRQILRRWLRSSTSLLSSEGPRRGGRQALPAVPTHGRDGRPLSGLRLPQSPHHHHRRGQRGQRPVPHRSGHRWGCVCEQDKARSFRLSCPLSYLRLSTGNFGDRYFGTDAPSDWRDEGLDYWRLVVQRARAPWKRGIGGAGCWQRPHHSAWHDEQLACARNLFAAAKVFFRTHSWNDPHLSAGELH